ncbi:MAG: hypothetical protein KatS3mg126_2487 [Lysobacteraceae bacterium]|nr:MAG: hypothetical protein KatS3mg126_2487 [Xanthomonadaceae bacterium]
MSPDPDLPRSPCVRRCCLDDEEVCVGCGRHLTEILGWHAADPATRHAILRRAAERLRARGRLPRPDPTATPSRPAKP